MKYIITFFILFVAIQTNSAQEAYLSIGKNFTNFDYTNSFGARNTNIEDGIGMSYEMGYLFRMNNRINIAAGITLSEFNANGGTIVDNYSWNTNYLGLQGVLKYKILGKSSNWSGSAEGFSMDLNTGVNLSHMIEGQQKINGQTYDLSKSNEFTGLFIEPLIGAALNYQISETTKFGFGYQFSKSFRTSKSGDEKLQFNNHKLQFNILIFVN
jgi:hypothetical protein